MNNKVDIIISWVDGSDSEWIEERNKYAFKYKDGAHDARFRELGLLRYLFRGIERFTPWVNKVFFVTCGHCPDWLNLDNPKLRFVKHSEYIPEKYLPTFNSHPIEFNFHRISDLSEQFIYFNDDMYLIKDVQPNVFFVDGRPCDMYKGLPLSSTNMFEHIVLNNLVLLNGRFSKRELEKRNFSKWLSPKNGFASVIRNIMYWERPYYIGFDDIHQPNAYLKSSFEEIWRLYPEELDATCQCKFRELENVNQYLIRYYQLIKGIAKPFNKKAISQSETLSDATISNAAKLVRERKRPLLCLNDTSALTDVERASKELTAAFEAILPEKSSFEL